MLSFRKGVAGCAAAMAQYLRESEQSENASRLAAYYGKALGRAEDAKGTLAEPRADMHPEVAKALGIDPARELTEDETANLTEVFKEAGITSSR